MKKHFKTYYMPKQKTNFKPGQYYYLSNVGNTGDHIFDGAENHVYFKENLLKKLNELVEVIAWGLVSNQYHLIIRIRSQYHLRKHLEKKIGGQMRRVTAHHYSRLISNCLSGFLSGYARAFNQMYRRKGSLFREQFEKIELKTRDEVVLFTNAVLVMDKQMKKGDKENKINASMTGISRDYKSDADVVWESWLKPINEQKVATMIRKSKTMNITRSDEILNQVEEEIKYREIDIEKMIKEAGGRKTDKRLKEIWGRRGEKYWEKVIELRVKLLAEKLMLR